MTRTAEYLAAHAKCIDKTSAAAIENLTDDVWAAVLEVLDVLNYGPKGPRTSCKVTRTHETLFDLTASRANHWRKRGSATRVTCGGLPAVHYQRFQLNKGQPHRNMIVVDAGNFRLAITS